MKKSLKNWRNIFIEFQTKNGFTLGVLYFLAIFLAILGLFILVLFLFLLGKEYQFRGEGQILLDKTGQVGDFIGGLIGTLWAFSGILLYFIAISLQRKDMSSREVEYSIERITNVIYNQYNVIKNSEKLLFSEGLYGELIFSFYRQTVVKKIGIPLNAYNNSYPFYELKPLIDFTNSAALHNYRIIISNSLEIFYFLIAQEKNRTGIDILKSIINANLNLVQLRELFEADLELNQYLVNEKIENSESFEYLRNKSIIENIKILKLIDIFTIKTFN